MALSFYNFVNMPKLNPRLYLILFAGLLLGSLNTLFSHNTPIAFIPNKGQINTPESINAPIAYINLPLANIYLHHDGLRITVTNSNDQPSVHKSFHFQGTDSQFIIRKQTFDLRFLNSNKPSDIQFLNPLNHYLNFYLSSNPDHWFTQIRPFGRV